MQIRVWQPQPLAQATASLPKDALHLYAVHVPDFVRHDVEHGMLLACLHAEEHARAARQVHGRDRRRFEVARGVLRHLLGQYLDQSPEVVRLQYSDLGKPSVARGVGLRTSSALPLHFNVSHSGDWVLYAFAAATEVGVDVECMRSSIASLALAKRFFHADEVRHLEKLDRAAQGLHFYHLWVLKEAYVKARGLRLMGGLGISMLQGLRANEQPAAFSQPLDASGSVLSGLSSDVAAAWVWQRLDLPSLRCVRLS